MSLVEEIEVHLHHLKPTAEAILVPLLKIIKEIETNLLKMSLVERIEVHLLHLKPLAEEIVVLLLTVIKEIGKCHLMYLTEEIEVHLHHLLEE